MSFCYFFVSFIWEAHTAIQLEIGLMGMRDRQVVIALVILGGLFLLGPMQQAALAGAAGPDLTLMDYSVAAPRPPLAPGAVLSVSTTVKNVGFLAAGSFVISFHLSTDETYGGGDDVAFAETRMVNSLNVGA